MNSIQPCHICGSTARTLLFRQNFSGLSSGSFLHGYDVCVCEKCGFGFADGLPPAESFDRYYAEMSKWDYLESSGVESDQHLSRFEAVAASLLKFNLNKDVPVLDVGCSTGGMLAALKQKGFTKLTGLDPSPKCAELARANYGIDVFTGPVKALVQLPDNFGLVLLSGVLEHFCDPNSVIQDIRNRLTDRGLFYVCVPDASRFSACFDAPYQQFSVEHILFFSPGSLANLFLKNGFKPIKVSSITYPYTKSFDYPVIEAVFEKAEPDIWKRDNTTGPALKEYIRASAAMEEKIVCQIESLTKTREPILVWGVGTQTQRLMVSGRLRDANIVAFIDSNPHYHGKHLAGRPIISPGDATMHAEPILISSIIFRDEIISQIRENLKLSNRLIVLGTDDC